MADSEYAIDDLDRRIIHSLQAEARHTSASEIAESLDVSARTVRNRISNLEDAGVIRGYDVDVDYEAAGYQLHTLIVCTAPIHEREEIARRALDVEGVVAIREVMTGADNVHVEVVGRDSNDLSRIGRDLNDIGLEVVDEDLIRNEYTRPFHQFDTSVEGEEPIGNSE
jgi:Lrp/AsnC family leucine-responsive transcriptional regulator